MGEPNRSSAGDVMLTMQQWMPLRSLFCTILIELARLPFFSHLDFDAYHALLRSTDTGSVFMRNISLRIQVIIIVGILAVGLVGAMIYVGDAAVRSKESIIRFDRERLATLTQELSRRYGSVVGFVASTQFEDSTLAEHIELTKLLVNITKEQLRSAVDVRAGFFHSIWNRELADVGPTTGGADIVSYQRFLRILLQVTIEEQREQWNHYESGDDKFIIVARPVYARNRLVGAAWALDGLGDEFKASQPINIIPLFQIAIVAGILLSSFFVITLRRQVTSIERGLGMMKQDISTRLRPLPSELGYISSSINELADTIVTQQKERDALQRTIQQNEKLASLGQLIAGAAHEIRTPLAAIKTRVQLWQRIFPSKQSRSRKRLDSILTPSSMGLVVDELDRMEHIVRKLLFFSKQRTLRLQQIHLNELIDSSLETLLEQIRSSQIRIIRQFGADNPAAYVDSSELREVVLNLLINAIEAMPEGGNLTVTTKVESDDCCSFCVEDTGNGITSDVAAKMFDPFFTTKETGTGLGLSIAYEIVRMHHGTIDFSRTNGASRFIVTLPQDGRPHHSKTEMRL